MGTPALNPPEEKNARIAHLLSSLHWSLLLISLPFGILNFVLPIYGKQIGANAVEIGLLFSVFSFMVVILRPLIGAGLDRFGRRRFFIGALLTYSLAMVSFSFSTTIWNLTLSRILQGSASALLGLSVNAIIADVAESRERARSFGGVTQSLNQGGIIGTFIGFFVLISFGTEKGWGLLFLGYALTGLVATGIALRGVPETHVKRAEGSLNLLQVLRSVLHSRPLVVLMLAGLVTGASAAMIEPILMIYLQEKFKAGVLDSGVCFSTFGNSLGGAALAYGKTGGPLRAQTADYPGADNCRDQLHDHSGCGKPGAPGVIMGHRSGLFFSQRPG